MNWKLHVERLGKGETVSFRPKGNSMKGRIESGQLVTISPDISTITDGDIVFCKVHGNFYVHLVKAIKSQGESVLYLIGNNKGGTNGWVGLNGIYGRVIQVAP